MSAVRKLGGHRPTGSGRRLSSGSGRRVGPRLAGVIVLLALRMRLSRARIREFPKELFELTRSTGAIDETIREAGGAGLPLEDALVADIVLAAQLPSMRHRGRSPARCCGCGQR